MMRLSELFTLVGFMFCMLIYSSEVKSIPILKRVVFVNVNATGANNGGSWTDAYTHLQSALTDAQGGYINDLGCQGRIPPATSFNMLADVAIYGG